MKKLICPVKRLRTDVVTRVNDNSTLEEKQDIILYSDKKDVNTERRVIMPVKFKTHVFTNEDGKVTKFTIYDSEQIHAIERYKRETHEKVLKYISDSTVIIPPQVKYISHILLDEVEKWKAGSIICLECGTGTGKTTLVKELIKLEKHKILFLTNRTATRKQAESDFFSDNIIWLNDKTCVMSYQALEYMEKIPQNYFEQFHLIINDECHFWHHDAPFQSFANASFVRVMNTRKPVKLLMSATMYSIMYKIAAEIVQGTRKLSTDAVFKVYKTFFNNSFVSKIVSFDNIIDLAILIKNSNEEKWLVFVNADSEAYELQKQLARAGNGEGDDIYINRELIDEENEDVLEAYNEAIFNYTLKYRVTICTKIWDNGLSIKDRHLKNVVLFSNEKDELLQECARKRCVDETDSVKLYIYEYGIKSIDNKIKRVKTQLHDFRNAYKLLVEDASHQDFVRVGNDNIRKGIYKNPINKKNQFNELGKEKLEINLQWLCEMKSNRSQLYWKFKWLDEKLKVKSPMYSFQNGIEYMIPTSALENIEKFQIERFISEIKPYINKPIKLSEKDIRSYIAYRLKWIFGKEPDEKYDRAFTVKELALKFEEYSIPLNVYNIEKKIFVIEPKKL